MKLFDYAARSTAVDPNRSCIVQAPAGSGKTSLLVERFINLLSTVNNPEACLAITFTNKAAHEMQLRVIAKLQELTSEPSFIGEEHIYNQILLNPNRLQILTIDGFCNQLVNKIPLLNNFIANCQITDDPDLLYQNAVERLLENLWNIVHLDSSDLIEKSLLNLCKHFDYNYELIIFLLKELLHNREQWLPIIVPMTWINANSDLNVDPTNIKLLLEKNLQKLINEVLITIYAQLPALEIQQKILAIAKIVANNIDDVANPIKELTKLLDHWPNPDYRELALWQGIASLLLNQDGHPRTKVTNRQGFLPISAIKDRQQKKIAQELKQEFEAILSDLSNIANGFLSKLTLIFNLPHSSYDSTDLELLSDLLVLLPRLVANLMLIFQEERKVDFTQVAITALDALGNNDEPSELALNLECKIQHILIDEFQDTSCLHYKIIEKIVSHWGGYSNKTIFIVGDPMQSIYKFRQANVGLFLKVQQHGIGELPLENLYLTTNFRSSSTFIAGINYLFKNIFPAEHDWIYHGVKYSSSYAYSSEKHLEPKLTAEANQLLEVLDPDLVTNSNTLARLSNNNLKFNIIADPYQEAKQIIELIQQEQASKTDVNIGILLRSREHASMIIQALHHHAIAYHSNGLENFSSKSVIADLYVLGRSILHGNDRIAWMSLLRGPLVGLSLVDLNTLFEHATNMSVLTVLQNHHSCTRLSLDAATRLNYIVPILLQANTLIGRMNFSILLKKTWLALGGNILDPVEGVNLVDDFLLKFNQGEQLDPLLKLNKIFNKSHINTKDLNGGEITSINPKPIQLMTIHKAKGLEFDIVILPGMDRGIRNARDPLFLWEERELIGSKNHKHYLDNFTLFAVLNKGNTSNNNSVYNFIKSSEQQKQLYEMQRLLYVAISRAKYRFYGFSSTKYTNRSFFSMVAPYVDVAHLIEQMEQFTANSNGSSYDYNPLTGTENDSYRLPMNWYTINRKVQLI